MSHDMSHDISKLPVWAQQRIAKLERDVAYYHDMATHAANVQTLYEIGNFEVITDDQGHQFVRRREVTE